MQYLLLIYGSEAAAQAATSEASAATMAAYAAYTAELKNAGAYVGSNRLRPTSTAATVRGSGGKASVVDGPFAETKEQLGGYYMIDVADRETALMWAARCPAASRGAVEVRPVWVA
jgi:hypothetical protein